MKVLTTYRNANISCTKSILFLGIISFVLLSSLEACQSDINSENKDVTSVIAIVYGRVMSARDSLGIYRAKVLLVHYPEGCKSSMHREKDFTFTNEKGDYRAVYHLGGPQQKGSCLKAKIQFPDSSSYAEPAPEVFNVQFNTEPPPDSVRVDFTVQDSVK